MLESERAPDMTCLNAEAPPSEDCVDINNAAPATSSRQPAEFEVMSSATVDALFDKEDTQRKTLAVQYVLEKDIKAADLKWSLFVAACQTYRYHACLNPFPPMFMKNETKDVDALRQAVEFVPPLTVVVQQLRETAIYKSKSNTIDLLFWALVSLKDLQIQSVSKDRFPTVLKRVNSQKEVPPPNLIFQVVSSKSPVFEEKWYEASREHSTYFAYHGSRLENFHSIVHHGLRQHLFKKPVFEYLSSELSESLKNSPVGYGWGGSILGSDMRCVALCEVINHPDTKKENKDDSARNLLPDSAESNNHSSLQNNELVRIRYLLVYSQEFGRARAARNSGLIGWFRQHKMLTFLLGYVVLLASVGLSHNKNVERYIKILIRKFGLD